MAEIAIKDTTVLITDLKGANLELTLKAFTDMLETYQTIKHLIDGGTLSEITFAV